MLSIVVFVGASARQDHCRQKTGAPKHARQSDAANIRPARPRPVGEEGARMAARRKQNKGESAVSHEVLSHKVTKKQQQQQPTNENNSISYLPNTLETYFVSCSKATEKLLQSASIQ